ncbi:hypothetical protein XPA_000069 [Xanthoria parietina]
MVSWSCFDAQKGQEQNALWTVVEALASRHVQSPPDMAGGAAKTESKAMGISVLSKVHEGDAPQAPRPAPPFTGAAQRMSMVLPCGCQRFLQ